MIPHTRALADLDQDIRDHIDRETRENIERGMSPEDAHYAALRKFGNVTLTKEDTRRCGSRSGSSNCAKTSITQSGCCAAIRVHRRA